MENAAIVEPELSELPPPDPDTPTARQLPIFVEDVRVEVESHRGHSGMAGLLSGAHVQNTDNALRSEMLATHSAAPLGQWSRMRTLVYGYEPSVNVLRGIIIFDMFQSPRTLRRT